MKTVDVNDLQRCLAKHLDEVEKGVNTAVCRRGKVVARITAWTGVGDPRPDLNDRVHSIYPEENGPQTVSDRLYGDWDSR